ncbi:hypothetical protein HGM15179_018270 [Zosterops borbonicus]|uniref:Integrase n=1 Tax=Zosterops borbonicus TaxID=364589 RepID=A0A8K1FZB7_9PASS|nr:hypothetical protein HGM15179_018270 [Zosterops borbonicus]
MKYSFSSDSDTDSETADSQVAAFAARGKRHVTFAQPEQYSSELHQTISKLAQLSPHHDKQEQQTAASSQIKAQRDLPSPLAPASSVSMPVFTTNPIDERQAALAKAALKDGDWEAANALSSPVLFTNGQAKWEPCEWKILQKAKETVTTYGLRSEAAKNIIHFSFSSENGGAWLQRKPASIDKSSTTKRGVIVIPGIIDADFTGQVQILAYALQPPVTIPKGSRIAKIVALENILPYRQHPKEPHEKHRMNRSFGSTGHDVILTLDLTNRPIRTVRLQRGSHQFKLKLLLDTGSYVSILNQLFWPSDWPLQAPTNHIVRVGGMRISAISADPICISFKDVMGVPVENKTDNGPAYVSQRVAKFLQKWGMKHNTGIPHSPTGQAILERANRTLKEYLAKQKETDDIDVVSRLSKVLFTLNYLCLAEGQEEPAIVIHHQAVKEGRLQAIPGLYHKNMRTGEWQGPSQVLFNGRGYMCVSTDAGPVWVPSRFTCACPPERIPSDSEDNPDNNNLPGTPSDDPEFN